MPSGPTSRSARPARRRFLPRTGPGARWPARARTAGHLALAAVAVVSVLSWLLARLSPERYLRLVEVYRSLPVVVVVVAVLSGVTWFAVDTVRSLICATVTAPDPDRLRRLLLDSSVIAWLVLTVALAVALLVPAATETFGTLR
ncbi:MAG: hypothetical protein WKF57_21770 [Nakamurella sp.]